MSDLQEVTFVQCNVQIHGLAGRGLDAEGVRKEIDTVLRNHFKPDLDSDVEVELVPAPRKQDA